MPLNRAATRLPKQHNIHRGTEYNVSRTDRRTNAYLAAPMPTTPPVSNNGPFVSVPASPPSRSVPGVASHGTSGRPWHVQLLLCTLAEAMQIWADQGNDAIYAPAINSVTGYDGREA